MSDFSSSFNVRAHHALQLWKVEYLGYSPEEVAQSLKTAAGGLLSKIIKPGYREDVYGTTPAENEAALTGLATFFQNFKDLAPDEPVTFTALGKDGICASCVIGNHCDKIRTRFDGDAEWIRGLRDTATELGLATNIQLGKTTVKSLFPKEIETTLTTDAATSKKLVGDRQLPVRAFALPVDRPLTRASIWRQERKRDHLGGPGQF
ncbi:MAG TPA: hypothetical protein VLE73_03105 [Candidatus Saccharimonadales bacterium]|nr:hypothetical protein [Candidatus Saccharimonadales bacterium]